MTATADRAMRPATALALGLGAGVMSGLFGVGGGVVLVPGLVVLGGLAQHRAHATSLAAIVVTAPAALLPFALGGDVRWEAAAALVAGALGGAVVGADVMRRIPADRLRVAFGVTMLLVAVQMAWPSGAPAEPGVVAGATGAVALASLGLAGAATGVLSALLGVGGGTVMVPALVLLFGLSQHVAEGTSLAAIVPTALIGAWRHGRSGYTDWRTGLVVGGGGVVGGLAGATGAQALPGDVLQAAFAVLLAVTGVRLIRRGD